MRARGTAAREAFAPALARGLARGIALGALLACGTTVTPGRPAPRPPAPSAPRSTPSAPADAALERAVLAEVNRARTDPAAYAVLLDDVLAYFDGPLMRRPGERAAMRTQEGPAAVREAATALRATAALPPLARSDGLASAARDHVRDTGPRGLVGHTGADGSDIAARVARYGRWRSRLTESIDYGQTTGRWVVLAQLVDDGVPGRGHRANLLDPAVTVVGVACGPHKVYGRMCVLDYAGAYEESR